MPESITPLLAALDLEPSGDGRFRGRHLDHGHEVVFGGQILGQVLVAACRAVPGKEVLSLHNVFSRGVAFGEPLELEVEVAHDGRSFATAAVTTSQSGRTCTKAVVLLHVPDDDLVRHADVGRALDPPPGGDGWWDVQIAGDVDLADPSAVGPPELQVWSRFPGAPDDPVLAQALLAYASDGFLIGTAMRPHEGVGQSMAHVSVSTTVLNQTISFHEPFRAADWLLLDHRSTYAGRGRSHGRAIVFDQRGRMVASFTQDNMIRA
jgi:acyl-CoA thioesterase-2